MQTEQIKPPVPDMIIPKKTPAAGERTQLHVRDVGRLLPEEIQKEILSRLTNPASIARLRCVSKSWRRLLSDDLELIGKILFSDDDTKGKEPHVLTTTGPGAKTQYSIHTYDTLRPVSSGQLPDFDACSISHIVGCSNGIFCISDVYSAAELALWNPTTSETKVLPPTPLPDEHYPYLTELGFGFDPVTDDYKLLVWYATFTSLHVLYLYSLKKDSWKPLPPNCGPGGFYIGVGRSVGLVASRAPTFSRCHWINISSDNDFFVFTTFDMSKETFTQLLLPMLPIRRGKKWTFHMVRDGSCLVAVCSGIIRSSEAATTTASFYLKVWAALDYEALARKECSWIRLYDVETTDTIPAAPPPPWRRASGGLKYGKFFVEWWMTAYDEPGRVWADTRNWVVDHKVKYPGQQQRVAYLPSTASMADHGGGIRRRKKKTVMGRVRDGFVSICRRVF